MANIPRTWDDVKKAGYAYGPKQEFDPSSQETHVWLPYGSKGAYFETAGVKLTDPGPPEDALGDVHQRQHQRPAGLQAPFRQTDRRFRFSAGWSEWSVGGDTVGGVEYSVDGQKWTTIRQLAEAKAQARIIDQFVDGQRHSAAEHAGPLHSLLQPRQDHREADSGRALDEISHGRRPGLGDVATTFFNCQFQLWVLPPRGATTAVKATIFSIDRRCTHIRQGEDDPPRSRSA